MDDFSLIPHLLFHQLQLWNFHWSKGLLNDYLFQYAYHIWRCDTSKLKKEQKRKIVHKEHEYKYEKEKSLAILEAIDDGYKQVEIAEFLNISSSAVSKIISEKSGNS